MIFFWFTWPFGRIPTAQVNKRKIISSSHHNNPMRETIICQQSFLFFFCNNAHRILRVVALMWARARSTADFRVFSSMTDWLYLNRPQTIVVGSEHLTITWGLDIFRCDETNDLWGHRKCLKAREECAPPPVNTAECQEPTLTGQTALERKTLDSRGSDWFWVNSVIWFWLKQEWFLQLHH